jgi:thiamine-phosphate pyrophosphorylase
VRALPDRLLVVTDRHQARRPLEDVIAAALEGGARWVWLRDRDLEAGERRALAERLLQLTRAAGATLTIGGDAALAAEVGAQGVHLPVAARRKAEHDGEAPPTLVGVSAHGEADVRTAMAAGTDYATLSPIFETASKPGYGPAVGLTAIERAAALGLPIIALGGITPERAAACIEAGAAGVAVMGEVMRAENPAAVVRRYLAALKFSSSRGEPSPGWERAG